MVDMDKIQPKTRLRWKGVEFEVKSPLPNYRLLIVASKQNDSNYQSTIIHINRLNRFAISLIISLIRGLKLKQFQSKSPKFNVAILPRKQFFSTTAIHINFRSWATVCSRSLFRKDHKQDAVVTSSEHSKKIDFSIKNLSDFTSQERKVDLLREAIHELLHTLKDTYLHYPSETDLPFSEAMSETIPFYILELGKTMPEFTKFRVGLKESEILTVKELWRGFSKYSINPIATNRAYASALLLGMGIIHRLEKKYRASSVEAFSLWLDVMSKSSNGRESVKKIADAIQIKEDTLWSERLLQLEGQGILKQL